MAERIEIVLTGKDEATNAFKKVVGANNDLQQSVKKTSFSFTELNSIMSIAQQGLAQLKKGYDFAKEGASIEFTQVKFERLAATIGTTADVLLNDLKTATRGTYSDMELMASAADFVGLGLAKTHDEAVRLASVSAGLNMDMNQLVLTLTNMTTMRFDALGVQVDGFDAKVEALKKTGMSADKAFKEAFLQQAEAQLLKVGNAADENIGTFMKLESTWKNFTDSLKMGAAEGLAPTIEGINDSIEAANNYYDVLDAVAAANGITTRELRKMREEQDYLVNSYVRAEQYGAAWGAILQENTEIISTATDETMSFKDQMDTLNDVLKGDLGPAYDEHNAKLAEYNQQLAEAKSQKDKDKINENIAAETAEYEKRATAIMFNIQQEAILNSTMPDSQKVEMIGTLAQSYGMLDQATVDAMISTQNVVEQVEAGNMAFETGISYLRGMTNNMKKTGAVATEISEPIMHLGTLAENSTEKFGAFKDKQSEMAQGLQSEAAPAIATVKSQWQGLMGLPDEINKTVNIQVNGSVPSFVDTSVSRGEQRHGGSAEAMGGLIQGFPMGGIVTGRGTSTSDSVPAWLSRGEYVVRAAAVQRIGAHNLERMEAGGGATGSGMYVHIDNLNVTGDGSLREELMRAVPYQV